MKSILYLSIAAILILLNACKDAEACFTYSPASPSTNTTVTFNASCSENTIGNYVWNFGDGGDTSVSANTITHVYSAPGTYEVSLEVVGNGRKNTSRVKMNVMVQ
jgi:PKD repeat protein